MLGEISINHQARGTCRKKYCDIPLGKFCQTDVVVCFLGFLKLSI